MKYPLPMTAPADVYRQRRATLAQHLSRPLLICAGVAPARNYANNAHPFRAGSSYLYYGGPPLEGAAWLIEPQSDGEYGCCLLHHPAGPDDPLWMGPSADPADIAAVTGIPLSQVLDIAAQHSALLNRSPAFVSPPCYTTAKWLSDVKGTPANPEELLMIIKQRLIKDEFELMAMRRAADITVQMHLAAIRATWPCRREADIAAELFREIVAHQAQPSFTPIVTIRGEILHNNAYNNRLSNGALLLVDAGAEESGGYASDATRTFPINGQWTKIQRHLYDTVLRAMREAIAACQPGVRYRDVHDLAARIICEGLVDAGLLYGRTQDLAERRAHTLFFPHGVGHLIGLDVHDMEDFGDLAGYAAGRTRRSGMGDKFLRLDRDLAPGMAVTIEPGIYFVPAIWSREDLVKPFADCVNRPLVDSLLQVRFGGIRIEQTIVIRQQGGPEVLTEALPTAAEKVADLIGVN
ncbi:MAG: Xaa-Pro aminopeptidase [Phycisphaerae bacterium]|nr:Xaa-Pro aminopeptidase [Phycisphaerae bacterium]